jgi:hydrogenase maturation protein HypF
VFVDVEGPETNLIEFQKLLRAKTPPLARVASIEVAEIPAKFSTDFRIAESEIQIDCSTLVSPDVSVCDDCLRELSDARIARPDR